MVARRKRDRAREDRISREIVVDAYGAEEQAMGWYYHLDSQVRFPFVATCVRKRAISPLKVGDEVELSPIGNDDPGTKEAIEDWHYWVDMGYQFG